MTIQSDLIEDYSRNSTLLKRHLEGLNHADTLIRPNGTGNCINWILGHMLLCRVEMLAFLGQPAPFTTEALKRYDSGSAPIGPDSTGICSLEQLIAWWDAVDAEFIAAIQNTGDETLLSKVKTWHGEMLVHRELSFFFFHEAFHLGQFEILRHLAGKTEALI
jgi:hypothetical protein